MFDVYNHNREGVSECKRTRFRERERDIVELSVWLN